MAHPRNRAERRRARQLYIKKCLRYLKHSWVSDEASLFVHPGRYHTRHPADCGRARCWCCHYSKYDNAANRRRRRLMIHLPVAKAIEAKYNVMPLSPDEFDQELVGLPFADEFMEVDGSFVFDADPGDNYKSINNVIERLKAKGYETGYEVDGLVVVPAKSPEEAVMVLDDYALNYYDKFDLANHADSEDWIKNAVPVELSEYYTELDNG